ncbi:holo-ACP synthase [Microbacterium oryzae]|uniref:holo-ACP synthase n=1 Tax=Microbacterium oryzae TaxID=743009 RepID=UPI0025B127FB|nr:holo-ACP synthase [Microbacterium oryzae]MDN3311583.1 holo-ACP synthase [Microbacterium oryzae]
MIVGIGVDVVDIARFERTLTRTPRLRERLFTPAERPLPLRSLAARYAAKEALIKALGGSEGLTWTEAEVARNGEREAPRFEFSGATADAIAARGVTTVHLSLSHDAGLAVAYVVAEGPDGAGAAPTDGPVSSPTDGPVL